MPADDKSISQQRLSISSRVRGRIRLLENGYRQLTQRRQQRRNRKVFQRWLMQFNQANAEVILGANFNTSGGVRHHIHAIHRNSSLKTLLAPDDQLLQQFGTAPFNENKASFNQNPPPLSTKAVHTHVLPWLIDWTIQNRRSSVRWVHTHHLWYYPEAGWKGLEPWQQELNEVGLKALTECDVPLVVSKSQQHFLKQEHGVESTCIPNGVDVALCDQGDAKRFLRAYRIERPFVLWVGRHDAVKNPADFVRLAATLPDILFVMAGGVTEADILSDLALEIPRNLKLIEHLRHIEVQDAISACRVLVVTSHREGLPTLVLEGMAHRKPLVVPNEAGCLDATNGEEFAAVYEPGKIPDLASKVQEAYASHAVRNDSRSRIFSEFDWRVVARKLDQIYVGECV